MARDKLVLRNITLYGYHGPFASEEELGQRYEVDLELKMDLKSSALTDDPELINNTLDLYTLVKEIVEEVLVRVRKPNPPLGGLLDSIEVEITRTTN